MNFNGYVDNAALTGRFEQKTMQTAANGSFAYTLTEPYSSPPAVAVIGVAQGGLISNSLNVTLTSVTTTQVTGFVTGVAAVNVVGINLNVIVGLTSAVTIQLMVAGA